MPSLSKADLCRLIPHQGSMCLLDLVEQWDDTAITCKTASHYDLANPLRRDHQLEAICGLEYAAQAMAVHVGITAERGECKQPVVGYLGSIKDLVIQVTRIDTIKEQLTIMASRLIGRHHSFIYTFKLSVGRQELLAGRASIFVKDFDRQS